MKIIFIILLFMLFILGVLYICVLYDSRKLGSNSLEILVRSPAVFGEDTDQGLVGVPRPGDRASNLQSHKNLPFDDFPWLNPSVKSGSVTIGYGASRMIEIKYQINISTRDAAGNWRDRIEWRSYFFNEQYVVGIEGIYSKNTEINDKMVKMWVFDTNIAGKNDSFTYYDADSAENAFKKIKSFVK